jgi:hypothetical protein
MRLLQALKKHQKESNNSFVGICLAAGSLLKYNPVQFRLNGIFFYKIKFNRTKVTLRSNIFHLLQHINLYTPNGLYKLSFFYIIFNLTFFLFKLKNLIMKTRLIFCLMALIVLSCSCKKSKNTTPSSTLSLIDARYRLEGTLTDAKDPAFVWPGNTYEYSLETITLTQVKLISKNLGFAAHILKNGINDTYYSNFGLTVNFDPATNKITSITNSYGQPSPTAGRSAILDPSGINNWDPVTKNIKIKYWMDEAGFAGHRTAFDETWVYLGAR